MTIDDLLSRLVKVKGCAPTWEACCPAHEDRSPSLSVTEQADRILVHCHAGCSVDEVLSALGLARKDLFADTGKSDITATYDYTDEHGALLYQVVRFYPKDFRQRRPDGTGGWLWNLRETRRVLYRLPAVLTAAANGRRVFVVEGEKDVHSVEKAGHVATCNPQGAGKWRPEYTETLRGARVVVVADTDEPGRAHAQLVAEQVGTVARSVVVVEPAHGKDVTDHLAHGFALRDLRPVRTDGVETVGDRNRAIAAKAIEALDSPQQVGSWGWGDFDRTFGPLMAGWMYVIGARPSNGKTTLLLNVLSHLWRARVPVLYFGTEMLPEDLVRKWAAIRLGLDEVRVFEGMVDDDERRMLRTEIAALMEGHQVSFAKGSRLDLAAIAKEVAWRYGQAVEAPQVIVLDHLHRMTQDREELDALVQELKDLANERRCAMIVACQLNRDQGLKAFDLYTPPHMGRYKGSSAIEENADVALGLFRPLRSDVSKADRVSVEHGTRSAAEFAQPNTLAAICTKHRYRGAATDRCCKLVVQGSRLVAPAFRTEVEDAVPF